MHETEEIWTNGHTMTPEKEIFNQDKEALNTIKMADDENHAEVVNDVQNERENIMPNDELLDVDIFLCA